MGRVGCAFVRDVPLGNMTEQCESVMTSIHEGVKASGAASNSLHSVAKSRLLKFPLGFRHAG